MSLDYNICKRLKDAGFPQSNSIYRYFVLRDGTILDNHIAPSVIVNDILEQVIKPTLSEIIEACGDKICLRLQSYWSENDLMWQADNWGNFIAQEEGIDIIAGVGSTPSVAVSNLWLSLNEK